ncbi:MAG: transglutaminase domain-containing protein [Acidobacteriota bacterium]
MAGPFAAADAVAPAAVDPSTESWYRLELDGQPVGWSVERTTVDSELVTRSSELHLELRRAGQVQRLEIASRFVETADHRPIEAWTRQDFGASAQETLFVFEPGDESNPGAVVEHRDGSTLRHPWPDGPWLTPGAAQKELEQQVARSLAVPDPPPFELVEIDPSLGLEPTTLRWSLDGSAPAQPESGHASVRSRWRVVQDIAPQTPLRIALDADAQMVEMVTPLLGLELTVRRVDAAAARAPLEPLEVLARSMIAVERPIETPRAVRRAVYRVTVDPFAGASADPFPPTWRDVGHQLATADSASGPSAGSSWRVVVDLDRAPRREPAPTAALEATRWLDYDHPAVAALHRTVRASLPADSPPAARAEALRRAVAEHVRDKDLGTAFASAGEVALQRSGDCTEHAVLLAALLRADGIPSRVAAGLVYAEAFAGAEHVFVYHLWTQAHLDGAWIDLDATLPASTAFDATHVTLDISLLDSALVDLAAMAGLIGRLQLEVEEVETPDAP